MRIAREEIFGPVLTVIPYEDEADAITDRQRQRLRPGRDGVDRRHRARHGRRPPGAHRHLRRQPLHDRDQLARSAASRPAASAASWAPRASRPTWSTSRSPVWAEIRGCCTARPSRTAPRRNRPSTPPRRWATARLHEVCPTTTTEAMVRVPWTSPSGFHPSAVVDVFYSELVRETISRVCRAISNSSSVGITMTFTAAPSGEISDSPRSLRTGSTAMPSAPRPASALSLTRRGVLPDAPGEGDDVHRAEHGVVGADVLRSRWTSRPTRPARRPDLRLADPLRHRAHVVVAAEAEHAAAPVEQRVDLVDGQALRPRFR